MAVFKNNILYDDFLVCLVRSKESYLSVILYYVMPHTRFLISILSGMRSRNQHG